MSAYLRSRAIGPAPTPHRPRTIWRGRGNSGSTVGGALGPVHLQFFVPALVGTVEPFDLTIGPIPIIMTVIDGTQQSGIPPVTEGGGPPPPAFSVTSGLVMELTFLEIVPRYAVEILDVTDGLVDP